MQEVFTAIFATIIFGLFVAFIVIILWGLINFLRFLNRLYSANKTIQKATIDAEAIRNNAHENYRKIISEAGGVRTQAYEAADNIRTKANTEADGIRTQASADAEEILQSP